MPKTLHLLKSPPDDVVARLIDAMSDREGASVVCLYPDDIAGTSVDWNRVVEDILTHEKIICWW